MLDETTFAFNQQWSFQQMGAHFPRAYGLIHNVFYHMLKFIYVCQEGNIQIFY